jgi:pilus assembly protein CpaF
VPLKVSSKPTDEKRAAVDERPQTPGPTGQTGPTSGSSAVFADPEESKDLAELFDQTGRLFVAGLNSGSRTSLNGEKLAVGQSDECRDDDRPGVGTSGTMPDLVRPAGKPETLNPEPEALEEAQGQGTRSRFEANRVMSPGNDGLFDLKQRIQDELLRRVNKHKSSFEGLSDGEFRAKVREILVTILGEPLTAIPSGWTPHSLLTELLNDFLGLGPLEKLLADDTVTEIMVNRPDQIYVERQGRLELTTERFLNENQIRAVIQRIIQPLGRHVDEAVPYVDARLADGSRVHVIIPPLALNGPKLTIRKFFRNKLTTDDLLRLGSLSRQMAEFLELMVKFRANILISGGSGSGKTTLLNVLSNFIPDNQRIITIEDAAELHINKNHVISLESRAASAEGTGAVSIRELVRNTLRMRPDRIVVGECRGGEALDMLQAMNTGHDGSLTTIHANTPRDALARLETLVLMAGVELPSRAIREQIASGINIVVQTSRLPDGSRKVTHITEVSGIGENAVFMTQEIFVFKQWETDAAGRIIGRYEPTGTVPRIVEQLRARGIKIGREVFAAA